MCTHKLSIHVLAFFPTSPPYPGQPECQFHEYCLLRKFQILAECFKIMALANDSPRKVNKFNFICQAYDHPLRKVTLSHVISKLDTRGQHGAKSELLNLPRRLTPQKTERGALQLLEGVGWT